MALPLDPASLAALASLQGTLGTSGDVLTLSEALNQRAMEAARQRTAQATQEAAQAGQQYQQAAAAPVPTPDALAQMLPLLTGNIASVIAQNPDFAKRGAEEVAGRRADLARTRADNLIALKDNYDKKALLAAHLGDTETEMEARQRSEQLSKTLTVLLQGEHENAAKENLRTQHQNRLGEIAAQGEQARKTNAAKLTADAGTDMDKAIDNATYTTRNGNTFVDMTNFKQAKVNDAVVKRAAALGRTPMDKAGATQLRTVDEVKNGLDQVDSVLATVLPHQSGNKLGDWVSRQSAGVKNAIAAATQSQSAQAAFGSTYPLAIRSLQAVAAGPGSGFRLNQSEINLIQRRWPRLNDNIETARAKLQWERWFLDNKEKSFFNHDWRVPAEPVVPGQPLTGALGPKDSLRIR